MGNSSTFNLRNRIGQGPDLQNIDIVVEACNGAMEIDIVRQNGVEDAPRGRQSAMYVASVRIRAAADIRQIIIVVVIESIAEGAQDRLDAVNAQDTILRRGNRTLCEEVIQTIGIEVVDTEMTNLEGEVDTNFRTGYGKLKLSSACC